MSRAIGKPGTTMFPLGILTSHLFKLIFFDANGKRMYTNDEE